MIKGKVYDTNHTAPLRFCTGKAEDRGETWLWFASPASNDSEGPPLIAGAELVLGVGGATPGVGTLPINHDCHLISLVCNTDRRQRTGTHPRSPPSSLTACALVSVDSNVEGGEYTRKTSDCNA